MATKLDKSRMACNKPRKSPNPKKKKVVKACQGGKEKIVHFGATGYGHNYSSAARKSFKARHKCSSATNKLSARYWACKHLWAGKGGSTKSSPKSRRGKYLKRNMR
jgi:activator of 2-hydroxyglutaryl-CoA dehydratase